jgi:hypothetical protein
MTALNTLKIFLFALPFFLGFLSEISQVRRVMYRTRIISHYKLNKRLRIIHFLRRRSDGLRLINVWRLIRHPGDLGEPHAQMIRLLARTGNGSRSADTWSAITLCTSFGSPDVIEVTGR